MDRETLQKYLLGKIDSILTGFLTARMLTAQDRAVLHAEYAMYQQDTLENGDVLGKLLTLMPAAREDAT